VYDANVSSVFADGQYSNTKLCNDAGQRNLNKRHHSSRFLREPDIQLQTLQRYDSGRHSGMTIHELMFGLITRPVDLVVRRWNWKAALFSSLTRGIIFLAANLTAGWRAAVGAMLAEWIYRALTSGF
jgi:hypothetical protein